MGKVLIAYFSRKGKNYVNGSICDLTEGNTEVAAKMIQELTKGELFQIEPLEAYNNDYYICTEEAKKDLKENARPELKQYLDSIEEYDTIYVGYPNYWGTMPMAVYSFLEKYDFTGKKIKPFCTHEGSGMGKSEGEIQRLTKDAVIVKGLAIHGADVKKAMPSIEKWI